MTRPSLGTLWLPVALALATSLGACGKARPAASTAVSDCTTCHGQPPAEGAHLAHTVGGAQDSGLPHPAFACLQCHKNVHEVNDPDHIFRADGTPVPPPAEVRFDDPGSLAGRTQRAASRADAPAFDRATRTCSNVYCHGAGLRGATADVQASVAWNAASGTVGCGKCHGVPPADHAPSFTQLDCYRCHGESIDASGVLDPEHHVNGVVELTAGATTSCAVCHGDKSADVLPGDPRSAPPTDTAGRTATDPNATSIGAHQNHLVGGVLGVSVACSECHRVPATLQAPGHLDNQVQVIFGALASKNGLKPAYNPATQTCSNVYCHGNFPFSKTTLPPPAPAWRAGATAVACGSCHDLPPPAPAHVAVNVGTQGCGTSTDPVLRCHPAPYSPSTVDPKLHIDGRICPPNCTPATP